jgi:serine/threonine-protein kinase
METDEISSAPRPTRQPRTLGSHYALDGELGRGGMAVVYAGRDLRTGATVAVKLIHPELSEAVGAARFRQEIRIASSLTHPHILPVLDAGAADGQLYLVMPLVTRRVDRRARRA